MGLKGIVAVLVGAVVSVGTGPVATGWAQDGKPAVEKGVKTMPLVTSLGPYRQVSSVPIVMTGQVVEIAPGGQTGRERFLVPSYLYVLEGMLTTDTESGPIGIAGIQYHAAGQSYSGPDGVWHNFMNTGRTPVRYILVLIGTPGQPTVEKPKPED
jgi:mannose-6-phosphate isomerase-like protein (cupin superfamily)